MCRNYYILYLLLVCIFAACAPRSIREAQSVVAQADSLWSAGQMYGREAGDSATLAQAYETLNNIPSSLSPQLSTTFAHACYHYGRLLRERENPAAAMEAFIHATHSRTHDYHILGRVYSNMGDICHLAGEYPLSYDMFERSANYFLKNGDSLLYYYGLNNMAYELAEQGRKKETLMLLDSTNKECSDSSLHALTYLTKARLYNNIEQYDSVLANTNKCSADYASVQVLKSQAFYGIGNKDSALYYAQHVMNRQDASEPDKYNILHILINESTDLSHEELLELTALRSDIETDVLTPLHNQWAIAVKLFEQDLNIKPDWRWLYAIIATLLIVGTGIGIYRKHLKRRHALLSQHIDELANTNDAMQQQQAQIIKEQTNYIQNKIAQIEQNCLAFYTSEDFPMNLCWKDYDKMCDIVNEHFYLLVAKLQTIYHLSEKEIRLCVAILIGISNSEQLADILFYSYSGIRNFKNRTAKKLGTNSIELRNMLMHIAAGDHPCLQEK